MVNPHLMSMVIDTLEFGCLKKPKNFCEVFFKKRPAGGSNPNFSCHGPVSKHRFFSD